jgi:TetR/AcrR family transcriptional regulator, cholesterol catabolism regulator
VPYRLAGLHDDIPDEASRETSRARRPADWHGLERDSSISFVEQTTSAAVARTTRQQARREQILEAATRLLHDCEYEQIQVRTVAEHAGVALGTLYRYFPSKEVLYAHVLLAWSETFEQRVRVRNRDARDDAERLRTLLRGAVRAYERAPNFFRLLTVLEVTPDPAVQDVFARFSDAFVTGLRDELHDTHEEDAAAISFVTGAALFTALRGWAQRGRSIHTAYERVDAAVDLIFGGPRPRATSPTREAG